MDRLPPETLFCIFRNALPHKRENGEVPFSVSVSVLLYISHVCRSWRNLSLSYGELWSHLYLDLKPEAGEEGYRMAVEIFDTWLQRTKQSPINFLFYCYRDQPEDAAHHLAAMHIITALFEQHRRWKDVNFYWNLVDLKPNSSNIKNLSDMRMLTSLDLTRELWSFWLDDDTCWTELTIDISQSPLLEKINLSGNFFLITGDEPIRTLTTSELVFNHVERGEHAVQTCLDLLKIAPFLTDFRAVFVFESYDLDGSFRLECERPVVLNDLHTLALLGDRRTSRAVAPIIDNLTLPSLKALDYKDDGHVRGGEILLRFLQRSMPPLTFLEIHGRGVNEDTLVPVLRLLRGLMDLRITDATLSTYLFRELTVEDADEEGSPAAFEHVVCPGLVALHLNWLRLPEDSDAVIEALINMVKSRSRILGTFEYIGLALGCLRNIRFKIPDVPWDIDIKNMRYNGMGELSIEGGRVPLYPFREQ